ncbi:ATP-binding protein [Streptomyces odontomachi]|uniref:ATP-binding protein n=1 Tax=Streptomyces odontomachi TaxID=2944940 RepID=UPI00210C3CDD|nr:ATP-binding protein [Streptomyces sp. ODS25]
MNQTTPHPTEPAHAFAQRFSSTPLGARLARHLVVHQLERWGVPHGTVGSDTAALVVGELAANAVTHGRVPGRDFEVRLALRHRDPLGPGAAGRVLRIEVSDTRTECRPPSPGEAAAPSPLADAGRGLALVAALGARWRVRNRVPGPGKTVVAELDLR